MYLDHFGLDQPPFRITPNQDFFYAGANRSAILDALVYAISSGEGIIKVVGEVGTGKTMLCRALEGRLPSNIDIIYLPNPSLPPDEILYAIANELGLIHADDWKSTQLIREMQNHLIEKHAQGRQVVVFIDEAQAMPLDSLEEIRLLTNLETSSSKLLQIVLFGQPEFDQHIDQPRIRQLKERITHCFYLQPFSKKDIADYLMFRMHAAGYRGPNVFSQSALRVIHRASQGLIRRVNILADKALLAAFSDNTHGITVKHVKAAINDSTYSSQPMWRQKRLAFSALLFLGFLVAVVWAVREWPHSAPRQEPTPALAARPVQPLPVALKEEPVITLTSEPQAASKIAPPVAAKPEPVAVEKVEPAVAKFAEHAPQPRKSEESQPPHPSNTTAPKKAPPAPATATALIPDQNAEAATLTQNMFQSRLDASKERINKQDGENLTIQLMIVPPEAAGIELERIQARAKIAPEELFVYDTTANNKAVNSITYGSFPTVAEARAALAKLPPAYQQNHPWLRTFKGVRNEIAKK